jgi:5-methylcytosine-specific restriction protein B
MADEIRRQFFGGRGLTVQFHPAVTYEDFVVGLSPDAKERTLRFDVRPGWLVEAARAAKEAPFLLVIDEINRADLGRVLGEAIYLFEPAEVGGERARRVRLPHPVHGETELSLPTNLYVLATMNTADRSIASMDLAVRRRFAFVTLPPDRAAVASRGVASATAAFDQVADVFVEHAPGDALHLMPGHAYFLVKDDAELRDRLRFEVIPLLDEYLQQGLLGPATNELYAVRDTLEDMVRADGKPA